METCVFTSRLRLVLISGLAFTMKVAKIYVKKECLKRSVNGFYNIQVFGLKLVKNTRIKIAKLSLKNINKIFIKL